MQIGMQHRIGIWSGVCLIVTVGIIIAYSAITLRNEATLAHNEAIENATILAGQVGEKLAGEILVKIEGALDTARTLAQALSGVKDEYNPLELGRSEVNSILYNILDKNPKFVGVYTAWEVDAFDFMDIGYKNDTGHDDTGRFIPYWSRNEEGNISLDPLRDYEKKGPGDYYQIPKKTKKECVIDPHYYPVQGNDTLMISLVAPILKNDTFYGIAGIDLGVDFLQEIADDVKELYEGSVKVLIISNDGKLAGITGEPELVGQPIEEVFAEWKIYREYIEKGRKQIELAENHVSVFIPVKIGNTTAPWGVEILIPMEKITKKADLQMRGTLKTMWIMIGISFVCAFTALLIMWLVARSIARPINLVIEGIDDAATQVQQASDQVSSASQSLAEGTSEQASSIQETSSSMEEMASMTKKNAEHAGQADKLMQEANQVVNMANESMSKLTHSMDDISKASDETSKIIKTIDGIAFQTNLLALNAAVEAARAGEAGAGFAVVADEVRSLAMRAADAAKNTSELIEGIENKVNNGLDIVSKANASFSQVAESAARVGTLLSEISESSKEQSYGIEGVNKAVAEMDNVVQQNAANAEESASGSEEMRGQAEKLKGYVSKLVTLVKGTKEERKTTSSSMTTRFVAAPSEARALDQAADSTTDPKKIPFDDDSSF